MRRRLSIWVVCYQVPQADRNGTGKRPTIVPALLPTGVYRASTSRYCWCALTAPLHPYQLGVRSYEFGVFFNSQLPTPISQLTGGIFLWHYPHDRSHWELSSKFGLSEARTFLEFNE
jgi:hypothetical protein